MTVRINTAALIDLLGDLVLTADTSLHAGGTGNVLLYTTRAAIGAEPGVSGVLAGFSHHAGMVGHTYTATISGDLPRPVLWPVRDVKAIIAVFKAAGKADDDHAVDIRIDGPICEVSEDPDLFDDGRRLAFAHTDLEKYAGPAVFRLLEHAPVPAGKDAVDDVPLTRRTDFAAQLLAPFTKIASRRGEHLRMYRQHQERRVLVQIGDTYRGAVAPTVFDAVGPEDEPEADVLLPDLELYAELTATATLFVPGQRDNEDLAEAEVDQLALSTT